MSTNTPALLVSTDFDGTLTDEGAEGPLAPEFFDWLEQARRSRRVVWAINTGRNWASLEDELRHRSPRCWPDWVVLVEREVHRVSEGRTVAHEDWNRKCAAIHADLFERADHALEQLRRELARFPDLAIIRDIGSPLGLIAADEAQAEEVQRELAPLIESFPDIHTVRNSVYFRFAHVDYQKGSCLGLILSEEGITPEQCFACGDHLNDLPMLDLKYACHLACPANAVAVVRDRVLEQGGYIASQRAAQGTAEALCHYFPTES